MGKNIVLIGFMGTGKSSVGIRLAQRLQYRFVDMDREIEHLTGMSVAELFRRCGETRFRSEEKLLARKLAARSKLVIATGGGTVLQPENIDVLEENGMVICLEAAPEDILQRVARKRGTRPLLKKGLELKDLEELLAQRAVYYQRASYHICTSGRGLEAVVQEIMDVLRDEGIMPARPVSRD